MYVRGEHGAVCLLVCDLLGMSPSFARPVRESVAAALGLEVGAVLTSCVHTHAGPSTIAGSEALGWVTPEGYRELLVEQCTAAARAAAAAAVPASLRSGRFPLPDGLSLNRRDLPYEPTFAVLDAIAPDGSRVGTLANVSIHPVALGPECLAVSSDWVGPFRTALQARAGGSTVLLSGALGDVNPHHVHRQHNDCRDDGFAEADQLGRDVAEAIDAVLPDAQPVETASPTVEKVRTLDVTMGETLLTSGQAGRRVSIELVEWTIGPVRLVSVPGEAFHALGRAIERPRTARARCRPGARVARLPARAVHGRLRGVDELRPGSGGRHRPGADHALEPPRGPPWERDRDVVRGCYATRSRTLRASASM